MDFVAPLPPSDFEVPEVKKEEPAVAVPEYDDGFRVGDPIYYWLERAPGVLEKNMGFLHRRLPYHPDIPDSGKWQITVFLVCGGISGFPAGIPYSDVPKNGHWTTQ